ncbi:hypothetical protein F8388_025970 [Cannabis sativa]|uniref:F-box domain-containing protein n=1 Tax=Cannabis sativa TaxID=3483 RepID=A0A7J6EC07_CANSA|nr:hypothetical protein F8388_025970 [Cannabis sativa]
MSAVIPPPLPDVIIPSLPNDLALNILARVPRQYHLVLSAVSKSIRFTLSSPQLYTTRSLLNLTENLLYFKVSSTSLGCCENWFAIYQKPTVSADPICNGLLRFARLPSIPYKLHGHVEAVVGHNIYVIGGHYIDESDFIIPSSYVWILDCRSHTWQQGPSIGIPRFDASVAVVDEKIYVIGGWTEESWVEVFDPVIGQWEHIPSPLDGRKSNFTEVEVVNGIILIKLRSNKNEFRLNPETRMWEVSEHDEPFCGRMDCKVNGVTYRCESNNNGRIEWYDDSKRRWKEVKGVMEGMPRFVCNAKLVNLKGRLFMMFGEVSYESSTRGVYKLCGGEIEVSRRNEGDNVDLWGEVHKLTLLPEGPWRISKPSSEFKVLYYESKSFSVKI